MSSALPDDQARNLAHAYLALEKAALYYTDAGYPTYVSHLTNAMRRIGIMFRTAGMMKRNGHAHDTALKTHTLALSLVETPKGV